MTTVPFLHTTRFQWDKDARTLTADMSELELANWPVNIQVYSPTSERSFMFETDEVKKDADGGIMFISYKPIATQSSISDIRLTIFND